MNKDTVIIIGAFSGLAGALLTQLMTGLFAYVNDRRRLRTEIENQYRAKKMEIGENFYFINGELMTMLRKNIDYWQNLRNDRTEETLGILKREMEKLDAYQVKLHNDNWKYNLVGIYFEVPFTFDDIQRANHRSHQLYMLVAELSNRVRAASGAEREELYKSYNLAVFNLCRHYEETYAVMQKSMDSVRKQLLAEFGRFA